MEDAQPDVVSSLPDRNLIYAPLSHPLAKKYWGAMNAAANFAFCNRHILGANVRRVFKELFGATTKTVYDVCHNIAKREYHDVDGVRMRVLVHRKGATRAFPPGHDSRQYGHSKLRSRWK
jgi:tRNA-splicing ligase RtcB